MDKVVHYTGIYVVVLDTRVHIYVCMCKYLQNIVFPSCVSNKCLYSYSYMYAIRVIPLGFEAKSFDEIYGNRTELYWTKLRSFCAHFIAFSAKSLKLLSHVLCITFWFKFWFLALLLRFFCFALFDSCNSHFIRKNYYEICTYVHMYLCMVGEKMLMTNSG